MSRYLTLVADDESTYDFQRAFEGTVVIPVDVLAVALSYSLISDDPIETNRTLQGLRSLKYSDGNANGTELDFRDVPLPASIYMTCAGLVDVYDSNSSDLYGRADIIGDSDSVTVAVFKPVSPLSSVRRFLGVDATTVDRYVPHAIAVPITVASSTAQSATRAASTYLHDRVFQFTHLRTSAHRPYLPGTYEAVIANHIVLSDIG